MKTQASGTAGIDWSKIDLSKLKASDIGVRMGPMLTEEEFAAYRASRPGVNVLGPKPPQPPQPPKK